MLGLVGYHRRFSIGTESNPGAKFGTFKRWGNPAGPSRNFYPAPLNAILNEVQIGKGETQDEVAENGRFLVHPENTSNGWQYSVGKSAGGRDSIYDSPDGIQRVSAGVDPSALESRDKYCWRRTILPPPD